MNELVSIVIPTYKRKESLLRLIKSFVNKNIKEFELVVVEQFENNSKSYLKVIKQHGFFMKYFFLIKPSTARAMNVGVKHAKGKYVLFLDDDVVIRNGILESHVNNFQDPMVAATVGRIITLGQKIEKNRRDTGRITWLGEFTDGFSSKIRQTVDTVIGCNMCWRRDVYLDLGGVDEQFTGNAIRLESDLSLRAKKNGYKIIFEPNAVIDHLRAEDGGARKTEGRTKWYFDFFSNEVYFFLKHRSSLLLPIFMLTRVEWILRCMFGFGREVSARSMITPLAGTMDGIQKYSLYLNTYEYRS